MSETPRLRDHLTDPSGGLAYHWLAWRRRAAWQPFHGWIRARLDAWRPDSETLVLVGPSGGYALERSFLSRWRRITVLEPDPLARGLLRRRFAQLPIRFLSLDALALPHGPAALAAQFPDAALLFCNVLGQIGDADEVAQRGAALRCALAAHAWASWHDVLSSRTQPCGMIPEAVSSADALARALWRGQAVEVVDHGAFGLVGAQGAFATWALTRDAWQVVEWAAHVPAADRAEDPGQDAHGSR